VQRNALSHRQKSKVFMRLLGVRSTLPHDALDKPILSSWRRLPIGIAKELEELIGFFLSAATLTMTTLSEIFRHVVLAHFAQIIITASYSSFGQVSQ